MLYRENVIFNIHINYSYCYSLSVSNHVLHLQILLYYDFYYLLLFCYFFLTLDAKALKRLYFRRGGEKQFLSCSNGWSEQERCCSRAIDISFVIFKQRERERKKNVIHTSVSTSCSSLLCLWSLIYWSFFQEHWQETTFLLLIQQMKFSQ